MMKLFKKVTNLLSSAATGKFRALLGKILGVPQALARKLAQMIKSPFKNVFGKPSSIEDYVPLSDLYISKRLVFTVLACAAFLAFFIVRYAIPYLEGRLWIPTIVINTPKFHTYEGKARVVSREGALIYMGELQKGEISGFGVLYDGEYLAYEGEFTKNNYDGKGKLYYTTGAVKYEGAFDSGSFSEGTLYYEDGTPLYEGVFENNAYKRGKLRYENGAVEFEGLFENGMYNEGALYTKSGGLCYDGCFSNGVYDGLGKEYENGRLKYEGEFAEGRYNGAGKLYNGSFTVYDGGFGNGLYNSYGKLYRRESAQVLYEGGFAAGNYEGEGTLFNGGRELYTGGFSEGLYNGEGVLYDERGRLIFTGRFYMGEIDYVPFIDADAESVREAFGAERRLTMLENTFALYYDGMDTIFEFNFADEDGSPTVQKIKLLGGQSVYGVRNGMSVDEFKRLFGNGIFTEYIFRVNSEDELPLSIADSELTEGDEAYCIKYDFESVYIRAFAESGAGNVIYYEIGGV